MIINGNRPTNIIVEWDAPETPEEKADRLARRAQFNRNSAWLQAHIQEVYDNNRGKCICVAGGELFVADTPQEAFALAETAHPEDGGILSRYIYKEKMVRIYAHQWQMEGL